jgi:hypothetical protein
LLPKTNKSNLYFAGRLRVLAGTVTTALSAHAIVTGRPESVLFDENLQLAELVTSADRETEPPAEVSVDGVAVKEDTTGGPLPVADFAAPASVGTTAVESVSKPARAATTHRTGVGRWPRCPE